jgi:hypothetical protein
MLSAIIGVCRTLAGTILGWFLNRLSQCGKLNIYPTWCHEFRHDDNYGGMKKSKSKEEAKYYEYHLKLDLYNSSGEPKIMRKIEVAFLHDKEELFRDTPKDDSTGHISRSIMIYNEVLPITIPAKTVDTVMMRSGFGDSDNRFSQILGTNKIMLTYRDYKDKEKKLLIKKYDFSRYFENHLVKE